MTVYVVTNPESGWDCVCVVCLTIESLGDFLDERIFDNKGNWDNMTVEQMQTWIDDLGHHYIIHEKNAY